VEEEKGNIEDKVGKVEGMCETFSMSIDQRYSIL